MKSLSYWQQFLNTGSVEAYLCYARSREGAEEGPEGDERSIREEETRRYAELHMDHRNDTETGPLRGI